MARRVRRAPQAATVAATGDTCVCQETRGDQCPINDHSNHELHGPEIHEAFVRQQLELELGLARFALVSGQSELFSQSLTEAIALLERHFDATEVAVESSMALLVEMVDLEIAPTRPDISGSLTMLRSLANRDN